MPSTLQELHDLLKKNEPDDPGYNGPKLRLTAKVFVDETSWTLTFTPDDDHIDIVTRNGAYVGKAPKDTIVTKYSTYDDKWVNCE